MNQARGRAAEDAALAYLQAHDLSLVTRNYRCRLGEIDLVMLDRGALVFVEVRARAGARFGGAAASVTGVKQRRLVAAARHFLMTRPAEARRPARFDVLAFSGSAGENEPLWIRGAFDGAA